MLVLEKILENPLTALFATLLLGGIALSGRFSVTATQILLALSLVLLIFALRKLPAPVWLGLSLVAAGLLVIFAFYFQPDIVPSNFGELVAKKNVYFSFRQQKLAKKIEIGDSGTILTYEGDGAMINFAQSKLTVESIDGALKVSTQIRNKAGQIIAELIRNEWRTAPPLTWDRNYSKDALEVKNSEGEIVLQIRMLADRIQLQGEWRATNGFNVRLVKASHNGQLGAAIVLRPGEFLNNDPKIEPIFRYPSETQLGKLVSRRQGRRIADVR